MARYQIVHDRENRGRRAWGIEEVVPGEKPMLLSFTGSRDEVEAEIVRLNRQAGASSGPILPSRPRGAHQLRSGKLTAEQRKASAQKAAAARWGKKVD